MHKAGFVLWLTGISGSGKTTLGKMLHNALCKQYEKVEFLDGDHVRAFFNNDLGYTRQERISNIKRIAFAAHMLAENEVPVVVANIAPYYEVRDFIRQKVNTYIQVYVKASLDTVIKRDVKGYYAKHKNGEMDNLVGCDDGYDVPRNPTLIVDTDTETPEESFQKIVVCLIQKGLLHE